MDVTAYISERGLPYLLACPKSPCAGAPLIVFLHGAGECINSDSVDGSTTIAAWSVLRGFDPHSRAWSEHCARVTPIGLAVDNSHLANSCFVLAPATQGCWLYERGKVHELIDLILKTTPEIDPCRVVLTGLSMGGAGVYEVGMINTERFAGISPICGSARSAAKDLSIVAATFARMPAWIAHGLQGTVVPLIGSTSAVSALRAAGNTRVVFNTFAAEHDSWTATYSDPAWWAWMRARRRGAPPETEFITLRYRSSWAPAFLVFRANRGEWHSRVVGDGTVTAAWAGGVSAVRGAASDGVVAHHNALAFSACCSATSTGTGSGDWQAVSLAASTLEFCLTDGHGAWDNAPGGGNYAILQPGEYVLDSGSIFREAT
jgi:hypothetical protein